MKSKFNFNELTYWFDTAIRKALEGLDCVRNICSDELEILKRLVFLFPYYSA